MPPELLLAMQAAGMITDYFGTKGQADTMNLGMKLQQASIGANIETNRLETEEASLQSMRQLRQTLGTQLAVLGARGTRPGAGSAYSLLNESVGNFNADERIRRLNALGKDNALRGGAAISRLQNSSDVSKLWQGFAQRTINNFPTSTSGWQSLMKNSGFGLTSSGS